MAMSHACGGPPGWDPHSAAGARPGLGRGGASSDRKPVIRLRDIYDPRPPPAKAPVRIRPPGPPPPKSPASTSITAAAAAATGPPCLIGAAPPTKPAMGRRSRSLSLPAQRGRIRAPRGPQVRFIDAMGLELAEVKFFEAGESPLIPPHVTYRLLMSSEMAFGRVHELSLPYLKPCFCDNMAARPGFPRRLRSQRVSLGSVLCSDAGITGAVHVLNLAFEKEVTLCYSFTGWRTHTNTKASWVSSGIPGEGPDGPETDIFHFWLPVPPFVLQPGAVLEFAICYDVNGCSYWDNNDGQNYKLSCHSYKLTVPKECEDSMLHFI